ncbi:MAG: 4Fe-4S dicluster domain-containing protein [Candidatus Bathyarchaeia archaeon]
MQGCIVSSSSSSQSASPSQSPSPSSLLSQSSKRKTIPKAKYVLGFDASICRWCRSCELVCSLFQEGTQSPQLSRIKLWVNTLDLEAKAEFCLQCGVPKCMEACPVEGAMIVDPKTGARIIVAEKCIACGKCAEACPFNSNGTIVFLNAERRSYVKCDLCGGKPKCVEYCPTGALSLRSLEAT